MNTLPVFHPKQVSPRKTQLAVAHSIAHKLGYITREGDPRRERYEDRLEQIINKRSLKGATRAERNRVVAAFEAELAQREMVRPVRSDWVTDEEALEVLGL